uniref:Uncharacterized protein n=1 Tax=Brassica campestris TaxID=3711 RepID=M4CV37_BRACM
MRWKEFPSPADPEINCFVDDKEEKKGGIRRRVLLMVELKRGLLEQFTHEMEPLLGKQGMHVQPDVDHVTVRWIPSNNLFAITVSVIDQYPAQKNVYQNQGVSFPDSC